MPRQTLDLHGSITALVTPYRGNLIDLECYARLVVRQIERGTAAIVAGGSTGEASMLADEEHAQLVEAAVRAARCRVPVIAGVGSPGTERAVFLARQSERSGADMLLCSAPSYVRPTQEGLFRHIRAIHDAVRLPILLYDVPGRTACAFSDETVGRLSELARVIGIKDATADLGRPARLRQLAGTDFAQLSGDDATALHYRVAGGHGCISVVANVAPALCARLHARFDADDMTAAMRLQVRLQPLIQALALESNPIPVKRALSRLGLCADTLRLPLTPLSRAADAPLALALEPVWAQEECAIRKTHPAA
ncbi:MAG: 4-hydroxy-tetrahydrodipicolinate synthase [Ferrovibrio sp.]|uniref:4-hydroxy-tetrahydrodipicolinate synthase n=1 Tax=Ferrovibrio sp. TaxID=1917215 RepID=UPI0026184EBD|nr:4-hydroxy-tetrahydrodipicolinate synthase [Ferrovibrio sp.]MCW0234134.1 4-hydroxy-tetrahydrodipicolinate synthase [Ferrovibrio sp.]